jgi:hypothetical protein
LGFLKFMTKNIVQFPGIFTSTLWSITILQASQEEDFLKDALLPRIRHLSAIHISDFKSLTTDFWSSDCEFRQAYPKELSLSMESKSDLARIENENVVIMQQGV